MGRGLWHCIGGSDQDHPQEKERQNGCLEEILQIAEKRKMKDKGEKERAFECRVPKSSKER